MIKCYKNLHNYEVSALDIFNDNSKFVSGGSDKIVILTDVVEGKQIGRFTGHSGKVNTVEINKDSNVIISGSYDTTVRCWDTRQSAYKPIDIIKGFKDSVTHV